MLCEVSVVVPVYKNEDTLRELFSQVSLVLHEMGKTFEIIFVDDCSPDGAATVLKDMAESNDEISIISLKNNRGQQNAVLIGLRYVSGDCVVIMDADLQDPPASLPTLLSELYKGYDVVFAGRAGAYQSRFRLLTSKVFKFILHIIADVPANAGIYCALTNQAAKKLTDFWAPRAFIVGMIGSADLSLKSVVVERNPRFTGISGYSFVGRIRVGMMALFFTLIWRLVPQSRSGGSRNLRGFVRNVYMSKNKVIQGED